MITLHDAYTQHLDPYVKNVLLLQGGTGKEFGVLFHQSGKAQRYATVLQQRFFDTDKSGLETIPPETTYLVTNFPAANYADDLIRHPNRIRRSPSVINNVGLFSYALGNNASLNNGLKTKPALAVGLMDYLLSHQGIAFNNFLQAPLEKLLHYRPVHQQQGTLLDANLVEVCLINSSCGGTGSGVCLWNAAYLHWFLPKRMGITAYTLNSMVMLPGSLLKKSNGPDLLLANTYQYLTDLLTLYQYRSQPLPDIEIGGIQLPQKAPFKFIYLFDGANRLNAKMRTRRQVTEVMNLVYELISLGREGAEYKNRLEDPEIEYPAIFSTAGAIALVYEAERTIADLGWKTAAAFVQTTTTPLNQEETRQRGDQHYTDFLRAHPQLQTIPWFGQDRHGRPIQVQVNPYYSHPRDDLPRAISAWSQDSQAIHAAELEELAQRTLREWLSTITTHTEHMLNQPGGLRSVGRFLTRLIDLYHQQQPDIEQNLRQATAELRRLQHVSTTKPAWIRRIFPRRRFLSEREQLLYHQVQRQREQARLTLLGQLVEALTNLVNLCKDLEATMNGFTELVQQHAHMVQQAGQNSQSVAEQSVVDEDTLDTWYEAKATAAHRQIKQQFRYRYQSEDGRFGIQLVHPDGENRTYYVLSPEAVSRFHQVCCQPWRHLQALSVEEILTQQGERPASLYLKLARAASPLISLREERQSPPAKEVLVLATQHKEFFADLPEQTGLSIISTDNPYRISLVYGLHGIALDQLSQWDDYAYAYHIRQVELRHKRPELFAPPETAVTSGDGNSHHADTELIPVGGVA